MNNMPPSSLPPSQPIRRGPSCWLVGSLTCLAVVVLVIIAIIAGFASFTHTATGKKFVGTFGSAMRDASQLPICEQNMMAIREAILRYKGHTGRYPDSLKQLSPTYLSDPSILHCPLDPNKDPSHVSYAYTKPTATTADNAPLLTMHWVLSFDAGPQTQSTDTEIILTFGGQIEQQQTRTVTPASAGA